MRIHWLAFCLLLPTVPAIADCEPQTPTEAFESADVVFTGRVEDNGEDGTHSVKVIKSLKGNARAMQSVVRQRFIEDEARFTAGQRYLIYGRENKDGAVHAFGCGASKRLENATDDVNEIKRGHPLKKTPPTLDQLQALAMKGGKGCHDALIKMSELPDAECVKALGVVHQLVQSRPDGCENAPEGYSHFARGSCRWLAVGYFLDWLESYADKKRGNANSMIDLFNVLDVRGADPKVLQRLLAMARDGKSEHARHGAVTILRFFLRAGGHKDIRAVLDARAFEEPSDVVRRSIVETLRADDTSLEVLCRIYKTDKSKRVRSDAESAIEESQSEGDDVKAAQVCSR